MALDDADKKYIADLIAGATKPEALVAALAPAIKAHTDAAMKGVVTGDALKTQLDELAAKLTPAADDKGADKGKGTDKNAEAVLALQKQLDAQKAQLDDARKQAAIDSSRVKVRDALVKAGADPAAMHLIVPALEASGVLVLDGATPGWKGKDAYQVDAVLAFEDGAKAWAATPDGKRFLPPSGASGTGDGGGARNGGLRTGTVNLADLRGGGTGAKVLDAISHAQ